MAYLVHEFLPNWMVFFHLSSTLISVITVEVGINVKGEILWKKVVHNCNKRGVEGGKINNRGGFFSKSISIIPHLLEK